MEETNPTEEPEKSGIRPVYVLLSLLGVYAAVVGVMAVFPKDGIRVNDNLSLYFPTFAEFFSPDTSTTKDINTILATLENADSLAGVQARQDSMAQADSLRLAALNLQYQDLDKSILYPFFASLYNLRTDAKAIRILHYGDSQIEGDRMTSLIRSRLQSKFGGSGPGLIPAVQIAPSFSVDQVASENWVRYPGFGKRDPEVDHSRYGMLASFCRFSPVKEDTTGHVYDGWIKLITSQRAYSEVRRYDRIRVFYGYNRKPVVTKLLADGAFVSEDSLPANERVNVFDWNFDQTPSESTVFFSGEDSPDVYAFSLESTTGVIMDNIPMRGASGTAFGAIDYGNLAQCLSQLNTKLFILQFGGNTIPYIKDRDHAFRYAKSFGRQIKLLRGMIPDASFIVIGPADMSAKEKSKYVTHPQLENVRDALKHHSWENGAAYFDTYEAMGGRNSMPVWVAADPPLAAKDYIHFSPQGAKKIAETFYKALERDYEEWLEAGRPTGSLVKGEGERVKADKEKDGKDSNVEGRKSNSQEKKPVEDPSSRQDDPEGKKAKVEQRKSNSEEKPKVEGRKSKSEDKSKVEGPKSNVPNQKPRIRKEGEK